jgi:hypothetical protein
VQAALQCLQDFGLFAWLALTAPKTFLMKQVLLQ